ncbi:hypothetical protein DL93DRAFT_2091466 [Clavulina sp. PMI_390]|nr:hypothetical protein DL93DRAFT_2091466 [Clavulina sp. PMI_390]
MPPQPYFEIDEAVYRSPKLKSGRSYRLVISWGISDSNDETQVTTRSIKPSGVSNALQCVWHNPSAGKRRFVDGPAQATIKIQYQDFHVLWKDACTFPWDCSMDTETTEFPLLGSRIGDQLVVRAAVVRNVVAPAPPTAEEPPAAPEMEIPVYVPEPPAEVFPAAAGNGNPQRQPQDNDPFDNLLPWEKTIRIDDVAVEDRWYVIVRGLAPGVVHGL